MDSNDPTNSNSMPTGVISGGAPTDAPNPAGAPASPWAQPSSPMPDLSQPTPIESLPGATPATPPPAATPPANSWDQPATAPVAASPWDAQPPQPMSMIGSADTAATPASPAPVDSTPGNPQPESPWGASSDQAVATSDVPTAPEAPAEPQAPDNSATTNPFLQPNAGTAFTMPQAPLDPQAQSPLPDLNTVAAMPAPVAPNPFASTTPDPLNTAFSQTGAAPENPFGTIQTPATPDMQQPGQMTEPEAKIADTALPASPVEGEATQAPANPWDLPPIPPGGISPAPGTAEPPVAGADPNQSVNIGQPQPAGSDEGYQGAGQSIPNNPQTGPLDLSALQNPAPTTSSPPEQSTQPGNSLPEIGPTENAPTDLSHLIAGDEQPAGGQQIPGVYTPPVAADQNPAVSPVQTPTAEGDAPPPGKHLNLTKVLLVAGIPVILIVAALSAYLILGVGQAKPAEDTSLPVEQTQAPLTNPPQQIVAPSPATIPEPSVVSVSPSPSPAASLSPAMQAAQRAASPSPTAGGSVSPSPAASASTSLPL